MVYQTDPYIRKNCLELYKYGCAVLSTAYYGEKYQKIIWTPQKLIDVWLAARAVRIITGDLNMDGDTDDIGECEIVDWKGLCGLLKLNLEPIPGHFSPKVANQADYYSICAWFNPNTKFTHFVVGTEKPVEFDPIMGGSKTVKEGAPKQDGLRIFHILS
jgi:hypothetical protein